MKNLKKKRIAKGMTQQQVADQLKLSLRHYQRMESTGKVRHCYKTDLERILT